MNDDDTQADLPATGMAPYVAGSAWSDEPEPEPDNPVLATNASAENRAHRSWWLAAPVAVGAVVAGAAVALAVVVLVVAVMSGWRAAHNDNNNTTASAPQVAAPIPAETITAAPPETTAPPITVTITTTAAAATPTTTRKIKTADDDYFERLAMARIYPTDRGAAIAFGHRLCDLLAQAPIAGRTTWVTDQVMGGALAGTVEQRVQTVNYEVAAEGAYCPQY